MTSPADPALADLFAPLQIGPFEAANRIWMAPLTRNRAQPDGTPTPLAKTYYSQRAGAGLIVTEATTINPGAVGYIATPGIYTDAQTADWRAVTDAVHAAGGRIFSQLWHVGRISHTSLQPDGQAPVAPSAIAAKAQTFAAEGFVDTSPPRALEADEIPGLIADFRHAARQAIAAGFDGVEVHAANGYLLDQFLHPNANTRTDAYGGSAENRARLPLEVVAAVAEEVGAGRVGVRLSPTGTFNDMDPTGIEDTARAFVAGIDTMGLAYLHVVHAFPGAEVTDAHRALMADLRRDWSGVYVANGDFDAATAAAWIAEGRADAITFGRPFISNPDLPERFRHGAALTPPDESTFYGGDHRGYTDYPPMTEAATAG
ncbi:MAG: alkene reductase [Pseudomonadota bacterium]